MTISSLRDLSDVGFRTLDQIGGLAGRLLEADVRLGITGLRRSGKTVFVTSLIDNLLHAGRLPFLDVIASHRFHAARLRPQPDPAVPRFDYERHRAALTAPEPRWPEPTRGISQTRLALRFQPGSVLRRRLQPVVTVNLDLVDYPGEWLLDLPLLERSYTEWSQATLDLARQPPRDRLAADWLGYVATLDPGAPAEEEVARQAARLYTAYLHGCRDCDAALSLVQPGRFVEPGDLAGAPLLTFCPLPPGEGRHGRQSLRALMEERFDAYKDNVVRRFFIDHFARLDRQVVLIDVLNALNAGPAGLTDMRTALSLGLEAFRHGQGGWLDWLGGRRIDRVLFAATKADHIGSNQHTNLRHLLDGFVSQARNAIRFEGATVETMAIASVKCTEMVVTEHQGRPLSCVQGVPVGRDRSTVLFPGEIPAEIPAAQEYAAASGQRRFSFLDFQPTAGAGRDGRGLPNIRLDQALNFLLGDYLA